MRTKMRPPRAGKGPNQKSNRSDDPLIDKTEESARSRVAMDFTGNVGRIVEDPQEVKAIAEFEEKQSKPKIRPNAKAIPEKLNGCMQINQPWFHGNLSRDQSTLLINKYGASDGAFLVRESNSNRGIYVLTFKCGDKVIHSQIQPIMESGRNSLFYTLDGGVTKFFDMTQLIEFYQLNNGCLPIRLTQCVHFGVDEDSTSKGNTFKKSHANNGNSANAELKPTPNDSSSKGNKLYAKSEYAMKTNSAKSTSHASYERMPSRSPIDSFSSDSNQKKRK